jgi:hypothetical protein
MSFFLEYGGRKPERRLDNSPLTPYIWIRLVKDTIWLSYDAYMTAKLYFD